jgi:NAD(P)-dependent dehydrogenase (short-subunit alcohol dehydrogenase family)
MSLPHAGDIFSGDSATAFQKTLDVDLGAVLTGVHLASRAMQRSARPGVILSIASAAGVFALPDAPVYSAAKGGLVHFTRSAAPRETRTAPLHSQFVDSGNLPSCDGQLPTAPGTRITPHDPT